MGNSALIMRLVEGGHVDVGREGGIAQYAQSVVSLFSQ